MSHLHSRPKCPGLYQQKLIQQVKVIFNTCETTSELLCPVLVSAEDRQWHTGRRTAKATKWVCGWITWGMRRSCKVWGYAIWRRLLVGWSYCYGQHQVERWRESDVRFFWKVHGYRMRGNKHKLEHIKVWIAIKKKVFTIRVVKHWSRLSQEAVRSPFPELDMALSKPWLFFEQGSWMRHFQKVPSGLPDSLL